MEKDFWNSVFMFYSIYFRPQPSVIRQYIKEKGAKFIT